MLITARQLINRLYDGSIRIPAFQRGFVWSQENVAFLMDSIYRGYPIGTLLLWRTKEPLAQEKKLGPFNLPAPQKDWPIDYVLDGQQRITSIFGVFQTELEAADEGNWFQIFFDLEAPEGAFEDQFVSLPTEHEEASRFFPLNALLDTHRFFRVTQQLPIQLQNRAVALQQRFQEAQLRIELIEYEDREQIAMIFERVNRAGIQLDAFQLLSAWTWSTEFDLNESLAELAAEVEPFGFGELASDPNLFMKCCAAVVAGDASISTVVGLHGPQVREKFKIIRRGIIGAIEFVKAEFNTHSLSTMPYPAMLVPLTSFFAVDSNNGYHANSHQREELRRWFWRSCFSRRYSSGVGRAHTTDIAAFKRLRTGHNEHASRFDVRISSDFFLNNRFAFTSVNTKTFILLLAHCKPRSLLSGAPVNLGSVLQRCNRNEFHHIFPKAFLNRQGIPPEEQNKLANFCFVSNSDNLQIRDKAPIEYVKLIDTGLRNKIAESNLLPLDSLNSNYDEFLSKRADTLADVARKLIE